MKLLGGAVRGTCCQGADTLENVPSVTFKCEPLVGEFVCRSLPVWMREYCFSTACRNTQELRFDMGLIALRPMAQSASYTTEFEAGPHCTV
eukprot:5700256-Amphidinium_carterae.1